MHITLIKPESTSSTYYGRLRQWASGFVLTKECTINNLLSTPFSFSHSVRRPLVTYRSCSTIGSLTAKVTNIFRTENNAANSLPAQQ
jgi:hypothetical protein